MRCLVYLEQTSSGICGRGVGGVQEGSNGDHGYEEHEFEVRIILFLIVQSQEVFLLLGCFILLDYLRQWRTFLMEDMFWVVG